MTAGPSPEGGTVTTAPSTGISPAHDPLGTPASCATRTPAACSLGRAGAGVAIVFPFVFPNPAVTSVAMFTLLFVGAASAWNMFSGFTGYMALGNAVFYGSGAYFFANLTVHLHLKGGVALFAYVPAGRPSPGWWRCRWAGWRCGPGATPSS